MRHPLYQFQFCPVCGAKAFVEHNEKAKKCMACGFVYYFNPSSAGACLIKHVDMFESGEEAARREVREETGLHIQNCRYLFSLPNLYMYSGFEVHTLDMFYECLVDDFNNVHAEDDAAEIVILHPEDVNPEDFGLDSIRKAVPAYLRK